jgi:hypothetical protein
MLATTAPKGMRYFQTRIRHGWPSFWVSSGASGARPRGVAVLNAPILLRRQSNVAQKTLHARLMVVVRSCRAGRHASA